MRALPCLLLLGCQEDVQLAPLADLVALEVAPAEVTIDVPGRVDFVATGRFADGHEADVTRDVVWSVDEEAPGAFAEPGRYLTSGLAGGHVVVSAGAGDIAASARVTVVLTATIVDPIFPPAPGGVALFGDDAPVVEDPLRSPDLVYPHDGALLPRDLERLLFQWTRGEGNDVYRLAFDSDVLHLRVYTAADRWLPDPGAWRWIVDSAAGGTLTLAVTAGAIAEPSPLYADAPIELSVSRRPAGGTLYYWSSGREGVIEGGVDAPLGSTFYSVPPDETCVGCHAVSRDGTRMALGYGGETLQAIDVPDRDVRISAGLGVGMGWATFSPDGTRLLVADGGALTLLAADTGQPVGPSGGLVSLPSGTLATHPDWSPLGDAVAVALGSSVTNRDMRGGRIALLPFAGDAFGLPTIVVDNSGEQDNNFFPRFTPDGAFLVYVHARSSSRNADSAELRLVPAAGGTPIILSAANAVFDSGTTLPSVAPVADGGLVWIAFSSTRAYGLVRPVRGLDQIWVAGLDLERARAGMDPSHPALWLPAQDVTLMNHLPVWAALPLED